MHIIAECFDAAGQMDAVEISKQKPIAGQIMLRGDEKKEQLYDKIDWDSVNDYEIENENGSQLQFKDVYHDATTIVIFIRVSYKWVNL